ncbi:MAG: aconitase X swivel domain-containing protein [Longimicrobiales bacterium]
MGGGLILSAESDWITLCTGRALIPGDAESIALVLDEPISFWGGVDPGTGNIIDRRHPQLSECVRGKILAMPSGRGSSSSSSVLAECVRAGTAPSAILLAEPDQILVLGALVAEELYDRTVPILVVSDEQLRRIPEHARLRIRDHGMASDATIELFWRAS